MRHLITMLLVIIPTISYAQSTFYKEVLRRATFYGAINGGNSLSDDDTYSVSTGQLATGVIETPFDYSLTLGSAKLRVLAMRIELMYSMMALRKRTGMQPPLDDTQDLSSLQKQTGEDSKEETS
tara:strand:+ start:2170 stop:2541 length:372 start_codon:yes stop_codon:yes gene_type:complete